MHLRCKFSVLGLIFLCAGSPAAESTATGAAIDGALSVENRTIRGIVVLAGKYTNPTPLPVFKNRSFCGSSVPNETLLVSTEGGLRNAVVLLRPLENKISVQPGRLTLDNLRCAFTPHVQVAAVGSELLLTNSDPILHTVHARLGKETLFNVGLPRWRQVTKRLDRPGVIRIDCDVLHTWMSAAIVVTDTPYFAVTDERGRFALDGLPLGAYEMQVWHERLGARRRHLHLNGMSTITSIEVIYSLEKGR